MALLTVDMRMNFMKRPKLLEFSRLLSGFMLVAAASAFAVETDIRRDATVAAVEQVMPSVVNIVTKSVVQVSDPFEQLQRRAFGIRPFDEYYAAGSGVVIDENGYLLTNDHVVNGANEIGVKFGTGTNVYRATL